MEYLQKKKIFSDAGLEPANFGYPGELFYQWAIEDSCAMNASPPIDKVYFLISEDFIYR